MVPTVMHYGLPIGQFVKNYKLCQFSSVTSLCTRALTALHAKLQSGEVGVVCLCVCKVYIYI